MAATRDRITADREFSRWCNENGFGKDLLNNHDRAVASAMGRQPAALRVCLEATERRSLQLIYRHEFDLVPSKRLRQGAA